MSFSSFRVPIVSNSIDRAIRLDRRRQIENLPYVLRPLRFTESFVEQICILLTAPESALSMKFKVRWSHVSSRNHSPWISESPSR